MRNWQALSSKSYEEVWRRIDQEFKFQPSVSEFPSFHLPSPFVTYDVSAYYGASINLNVYRDLEEKSLQMFQELVPKDEFLLALEWQHEGYRVNPHLNFPKNEWKEWIIPVFPDGDYYFFIEKDFNWGILGHPWEGSISLYGKDLLYSLEKNKPAMFLKIIRQKLKA
ncbi:DUF2716 domain-containing protein [Halobacillus sp. Nhm2S1]|uniref:DUF2716 domain-containing protein n=1 Tax=Halobacillus sp. Nhm2S1 TaxID=2866716 RepID=UPI001C72C776|nr:DUF2716 domain-containing protein [Halobacillus sp. Nhm2S1]MBX0356806.1 DUF2716 domain-containing protein [Halobacillus sp. Nhm2S1]